VRRGERSIELTQREFELLEYLHAQRAHRRARASACSRRSGATTPFATTNTIEVFVSNLRRKLEAGGEPVSPHHPRCGYVLRLDRIPIRWRLAGGSAILTLTILCAFAVAVGALTSQRIHAELRQDVEDAADNLRDDTQVMRFIPLFDTRIEYKVQIRPNLDTFVRGEDAAARLVLGNGYVLRWSKGAPDFGPPVEKSATYGDWIVETRRVIDSPPEAPPIFVQYARRNSTVDGTVRWLRLFLVGGVIGGAGLALLAGLTIARRAMRR
jgi:hypothetical protein